MGRSMKGGNPRMTPKSWNFKEKKRCFCGKRAKDYVDGKPLCRVHSPYRSGYGGVSV